MMLTMFYYGYHFTDHKLSRHLLIIIAGIKLAWNVISGDIVSVKKIYICYSPAERSVLEEIAVPEVLHTVWPLL